MPGRRVLPFLCVLVTLHFSACFRFKHKEFEKIRHVTLKSIPSQHVDLNGPASRRAGSLLDSHVQVTMVNLTSTELADEEAKEFSPLWLPETGATTIQDVVGDDTDKEERLQLLQHLPSVLGICILVMLLTVLVVIATCKEVSQPPAPRITRNDGLLYVSSPPPSSPDGTSTKVSGDSVQLEDSWKQLREWGTIVASKSVQGMDAPLVKVRQSDEKSGSHLVWDKEKSGSHLVWDKDKSGAFDMHDASCGQRQEMKV